MSAHFQLENWLNHIHIVLVETTLPANIGSVARAMKTMGFGQLHLVNPKHPLDEAAFAHAAGAKDVLETVSIHHTLADALKNSGMVWAASSRQRSMPQPHMALKQASGYLQTLFLNQPNRSHASTADVTAALPKVSILFGREDRGLTNAELAHAQYHVSIPANEQYPVLNLAAAVQIFCYEIRQSLDLSTNLSTAAQSPTTGLTMQLRTDWDEPPATHEQLTQLEEKVLALAKQLSLYQASNPRNTEKRIKRLLLRTQLDRMEYNLLRAALKKLV